MNFFKKDNKELEEKFNAGLLKKEDKEPKEEKKQEEKKELDFEQLMDERQQIRKDIEKSLKKLEFTKEEINETLKIVDVTYEQIQTIKDVLIGTNINNDPEKVTNEAMALIAELTQDMQAALKKKVREIMLRRPS